VLGRGVLGGIGRGVGGVVRREVGRGGRRGVRRGVESPSTAQTLYLKLKGKK
jgi:hypothetical protein